MANEQIDQDIIERLMREDSAFMYKIQLVKDEIITNLGDYASSIGEFEDTLGLDDNESRKLSSTFSAMTSSLGTIGDKILQLQIANNAGNVGSDGVLEREAQNIVITDMSDKVYDNLNDGDKILQSPIANNAGNVGSEGVFKREAQNVVITDMSDKVYDNLNDGDDNNYTTGGFLDVLSKLFNEKRLSAGGFGAMLKGALLAKLGLAGAFAGVTKLGFAGLVISAIAINAFNGLKGYLMADEWGVDKVSAIFGGIFGAGSTGGKVGAKKGAIGGAVSGMALGIPFGIIGMVIGGAIGGAVGAIGGWIGSEKLANEFSGIWNSPLWRTIMMTGTGAIVGGATGGPVGLVIGAIIGAALSAITLFISEEQRNKISSWWTDKNTNKRNKELRAYSSDPNADLSDAGLDAQMKEWNLVNVDKTALRYLKRMGIDVLDDKIMYAINEFSKERWGKELSEYEDGFALGGEKGFARVMEQIVHGQGDPALWIEKLIQKQNTEPIEIVKVTDAFMDSSKEMKETVLLYMKAQKVGQEDMNNLMKENSNIPRDMATEIMKGITDGIIFNIPPSQEPVLDFSEMRDSTYDSAYAWRGDFHSRGERYG